MDPELLNLFLAASKAQGGRSKVLSALNNPWIAMLSGAYDPVAAQGDTVAGSGQLWNTYAGNPDYPELQSIINTISQGGDQYQVQEQVNRVLGGKDTAGFFSADNLSKLAQGLYKEYTGGGTSSGKAAKQDVFSKAGIRSPLDVYTAQDVPVPDAVNKSLVSLIPAFSSIMEKTKQAKAAESGALRDWKSAQNEEAKNVKPKGVPATAYQWYPNEYFADTKTQESRTAKKKAASEQSRQAMATSGAMQMEQDKQAAVMDAMKRGVLRAYQEAGRTPAKDQMANIFKFLASTGK